MTLRQWSPSTWGKRFTGASDWLLHITGDELVVVVDGTRHVAPIAGFSPLRINHGIFWTDLTLRPGSPEEVRVDGIPNRHGADIASALDAVVVGKQREEAQRAETARKASRLDRFAKAFAQIRSWRKEASAVVAGANQERRWLTSEDVQGMVAAKPALDVSVDELLALRADDDVRAFLGDRLKDADAAIALWGADLVAGARRRNERHTVEELEASKDLFDRVERRPLTEEQARAVICFDNRVQVVASAGSGKTSTMVAKAAYAIKRGLVPPERIVMLAFNTAAAAELSERAARSFERLGMADVAVKAKTFHALGIEIIGQTTGRKPSVPAWASGKVEGIRKLAGLIEVLKDRSVAFRTRWDMFRLVFGRDVPSFGKASLEDEWDAENKRGALRTLRGELVKSMDECVIANWLFYNGVDYGYERNYEFDTATPTHSQYRPDFFYPSLGLYHEHFALNKKGEAPKEFAGYLDGVEWKRAEHARRDTALIETTSHQLWTGKLFGHLAAELEARGIRLDPNPDRPLPEQGRAPIEHLELVELMRGFICHAKSNNLTHDAMVGRLRKMPEDTFRHRHRLFLQLADPIRKAWDAALAKEGGIDFEDMLNEAASYVETGRYRSPYELVMADEFQDASWARARLCQALVKEPGRHLFAVGDDWQSINRFAGADVSVMTGFEDWCGLGQVLRLEQTFRCPQALCDVAGAFVMKNPAQLRKEVRSDTPAHGPVLRAFQVTDRDKLQGAVRSHLLSLRQTILDGTVPRGPGKTTVFVLGRYRADERYVPLDWQTEMGDVLDVRFSTIHSSKGAEADYVVLPGLVRKGFPNLRRDDPVLSLAMPGGDLFALSEERRLLYVALTRARRSVALFTVLGQASAFLDELVKDGSVLVTDTEGVRISEQRCPVCARGVMVQRHSQYGPFVACTNFPACRHKVDAGRARTRQAGR